MKNLSSRVSGTLLLTAASVLGMASIACAETTRHEVVNGEARIEVLAEGSGPLIVLLPSAFRGAEDFDPIVPGLALAGFRVLRPQPRGIGASTGPMTGISLKDFARDVAAVIAHERAGPAVVAGHAYGNWVARVTSIERPDLVRAVIVIAAAKKGPIPKELLESIDASSNASLSDAQRLVHLRRVFFAPASDAREYLKGWHPSARPAQRAASAASQPQSDWWHAGGRPMLDLQAEADPLMPRENSNDLRNEFGERVTVTVIPGASHALVPEQPAAVVKAIVDYVRALRP